MTTIEEIEARLAATEPGPWVPRFSEPYENADGFTTARNTIYGDDILPVDATFIAHAPEDIRFLLDRLTDAENEKSEVEDEKQAAIRRIAGFRIWGHWRGEDYVDGFNAALEASGTTLIEGAK